MALAAFAFAAVLIAGSAAFASSTTTYAYDAWGRVVSATYANGITVAYTYDAAGNRTQVKSGSAPVANAVSVTVEANSSANPVPLNVSGSYTSVAVSTGASHGTATASGTSITYTPTSGYAGADSFAYTATNPAGTSPPATVTVAVAPLAQSVGMTVAYDSANNPAPLSVVGVYTSVALASNPSHGSATASGTSISYTPASSYFGADSFTYTASNSVATSGAATVSVTVNPQPPVAGAVTATVYNNTTNNPIPLSITGGTQTSVAVSTQAAHGTATASGITIAYTPASNYTGSDSFAYTATNAGGTSSPATASITVLPMTATASVPLNCPTGAPTYICGSGAECGTTFSGLAVSVTVQGGSGSYTYAWAATAISSGTRSTGGTASSYTLTVSGVKAGLSANATYACTVTDKQATSNGVKYLWLNTSSS